MSRLLSAPETGARMALRKTLAMRPDPTREIPAEDLDGPGPRLALRGRFESAPGQQIEGRLVVGPLYHPSRTLALHLVVPGRLSANALPNGRLLLSIRTLFAEIFGTPTMMAPVFAILRDSPADSLVAGQAVDGTAETRILMRGGALLWDDLVSVSAHARLSIPRRPDVLDYRVIDAAPA